MRTRLWRSRAAYLLAVDLILVLAGDAGCKHGQGGKPLDTAPGAPEYQALAWVGVPGARVNVAGGNLQVKRTDLSLDTRLGSLSIGATYNSHDGRWLWSFDVRYDGTTFVDASGAEHDLRQVDDGKAIPGTVWVKLDGTRLKTKGGFRHVFDASSGRLLRIRRASSAYPRLVYVQAPVAGVDRTVAIQQCTAATTCGDVFTVAYDAEGRVTQITDRAGRSADFAYDGEGRLTAARDGLDVERGWPGNRYEYGGDRLTSITNSEQERIEIDYQARRVVAVRPIGEENPVHRFRYFKQQAGLYSTVYTDPLGFEAAYRYDAERRIRTVDNALGERISLDWVGRRPVAMTLPDGVTTLWTYAGDDVATEADAAGNVLQFAYAPAAVNREDPFARPIATVSDTLGTVEARAYDSEGRLESIENGAGDTTTFFYDADEMLYRVINPANGQVVFTDYGDHGHPETATAQLSTSASEYDPVGNLMKGTSLASETAPGWGGVVSRQFDADRNPSSILLVNQWSGGAGELQTGTVTMQYRSDGRRTSIARPNGGDTEFLYDSLGRMVERRDFATGVGHGAWQSTFFEYDAASRLTAIERPNGMREEFGYDAAGRRNLWTIVRDGLVESTALLTFEDGRLTRVVDSVHGGAETYSYDSAGRPALIQYPDGESLWLGYDARSRQTVATLVADDLQVIRTLERGYDGADRETSLKEDGQLLLDREYEMGRLSRTTYGNGLEREVTYEDILTGFIDTIETRFV
ncbi:MAG: hypothetical protein O7G30_03795, partial [Proteobacteria bacterium]|nr:hypothetical protein [Pseudomonadota bacterium]